MAKGNTLYSVIAGNRMTGYHVVYESTKRAKADKYAHDLTKVENDYDKIQVVSKPLSFYDRKREWEDE